MRYYPEDEKELERLNAPAWMLELLKLNPAYCSWGPHEDYMTNDGTGWNSRVIRETWKGNQLGLDDLNEVANFYFSVNRANHDCPDCDGSNYNPETKKIADSFYQHSCTPGVTPWNDKITQDEVQALVDANRLHDFTREFNGEKWVKTGKVPTAAEVNTAQHGRGMGHDAINRWILIETRAKRLGVWGECEKCEGGSIYDEPEARVSLTLWVLHPRKGCSRGWEYTRIEQADLPEIFSFLRQAAERNAARFAKIPA